MSPRTPRQNREIREQTRQQILDAAFDLFAREGFSKTSIAAIAQKAGVSKGLIYHYFGSKKEMLDAIFGQLVEIGDEMLDFPDHFTSADKIRQVLEQTFEFIEKQTDTGRLMISLALQPETFSSLKPKIDAVNERQMGLYVKMLEELGYNQPELEAYKLGAIMDGILLGYTTMGNEYPLKKMKDKIIEEYVPS